MLKLRDNCVLGFMEYGIMENENLELTNMNDESIYDLLLQEAMINKSNVCIGDLFREVIDTYTDRFYEDELLDITLDIYNSNLIDWDWVTDNIETPFTFAEVLKMALRDYFYKMLHDNFTVIIQNIVIDFINDYMYFKKINNISFSMEEELYNLAERIAEKSDCNSFVDSILEEVEEELDKMFK